MPKAAPKPCRHLGCTQLVTDGTSRCAAHKVVPGSFADRNRGNRHQRGYGTAWDKLRAQVLKRDAGICQPCLAEGIVHSGTDVDHIVPKAEGGTDALSNLRCICRARHQAKTGRDAARGRARR
ncbi:HNH endonuclease [Eleftheria terrae]|uniref:HNH endonuclease n=1 Tax=Eleftheria terrae TaxID=1597781 RepID=UPI00263BDCCC|nr:HNH endonuclease signature motif containing protein [Eleftheria terrae]WKB52300.1 HNH endonuclease [Eleftheria terrae]